MWLCQNCPQIHKRSSLVQRVQATADCQQPTLIGATFFLTTIDRLVQHVQSACVLAVVKPVQQLALHVLAQLVKQVDA